jgi:hypothetical protein
MRIKIFSLVALLCFAYISVSAQQKTYQIKADTVRIFNSCDTAELVLENRTRSVLNGVLTNKGNGVTEFRKVVIKLNDSMYVFSGDTLNLNYFRQGGNSFGAAAVLGTNDNYPLILKKNGRPFLSTFGNKNILMGDFAIKGDSSFNENILLAHEELSGTTKNVQRSVAVGFSVYDSAGNWNDPALGNVVIGYRSGRRIRNDYNIVIGAGSLKYFDDTTGVWGTGSWGANVAIGLWSLEYLKTGNQNIGIGESAGGNANGSRNLYLGAWHAANVANQSLIQTNNDVVMIGHQHNYNAGQITLSNSTLIGGRRINTTLNNVIILGGTFPAAQNVLLSRYNVDTGEKLQVEGSGLFTQTLKASGTGSSAFKITNSYTPTSSADAAGTTGTIAWDENFIYIKTTSGWKRSALTTF